MRRVRGLWAACCLIVGCFEDPPTPGSGDETGTSGGATDSDPQTSAAPTDTSAPGTDTGGDDAAETTTAADATGSTDDGGPACPDGAQCSAVAPRGWAGPFVVAMGAGEAPPCPAAWPDPISAAHAELSAPPFACSCSCTPPASVCSASVALYLDDTCTSFDIAHEVNAGGCVQTNGASSVLATATTDPSPAACTAEVRTTPTPASWGTSASVCAPTMPPPACDDGVCVPPLPDGASICIVREGEHACPPGPYEIAGMFFTGVQDDRACGPCTCGTPEGTECATLLSGLEQFDTGDCSGRAVDTVLIGACGLATTSARYVPQDVGACSMGTDTEPVGDATPAGPLTLCCAD